MKMFDCHDEVPLGRHPNVIVPRRVDDFHLNQRRKVELGRSRMTIQDLLGLTPGSVIELDKIAGEPLDIVVNDRLIARGEAVVVNDKFGIRITDIVSKTERIARLR